MRKVLMFTRQFCQTNILKKPFEEIRDSEKDNVVLKFSDVENRYTFLYIKKDGYYISINLYRHDVANLVPEGDIAIMPLSDNTDIFS